MTLRSLWRDIRSKHYRIGESSGSLGIIGIVALIIASALILWRQFLGGFSKWVAVALMFLVPLLGL